MPLSLAAIFLCLILTELGAWPPCPLRESVTATPIYIGGSRGGVRDARPPLGVQILSISCSFRENLACSRPPWRVHAPPLGKILDPPLIYVYYCFQNPVKMK